MSQPTVNCPTCNSILPIQVTRSNRHGNGGRLYRMCRRKQPDGKGCDYFRWASPKPSPTSSATSSPNIDAATPATTSETLAAVSDALTIFATMPTPSTMPMPSAPLAPMPIPPAQLAASALQIPTLAARCQQCPSTRLHPECTRHKCKMHCIASGGCAVKTHRSNTVLPSVPAAAPGWTIDPATSATATSLSATLPTPNGAIPGIAPAWVFDPAPTMSVAPAASSSTPILAPAPSVPPTAVPSTISARPRYASQIPPIFTEQLIIEQQRNHERHAEDAMRLSNLKNAQHHIIAYGWAKDGEEPTICQFQLGKQWPHFAVNMNILAELNLAAETGRVMLYNPALSAWAKVSVDKDDFIVTVKEQDRVFFKAVGVSDGLTNFSFHYNRGKAKAKSHIREQLPQQRSEVRRKYKERGLSTPVRHHASASVTPSAISISDGEDSGTELPSYHQPAAITPTSSRKRMPSPSVISISDSEPSLPIRSPSVVIKTEQEDEADDRRKLSWPAEFYAIDIQEGFDLCDIACKQHESVGNTFTKYFGVPFMKSTYYNHRQRWDEAPEAIKKKCLDAERTDDGLWSTFMLENNKHRLATLRSRGHATGRATRRRVC